jgi:hypothetical protein
LIKRLTLRLNGAANGTEGAMRKLAPRPPVASVITSKPAIHDHFKPAIEIVGRTRWFLRLSLRLVLQFDLNLP